MAEIAIDARTTALVIQDLQNDTVSEGGAFADTGSYDHATAQDVVANVARLAGAARAAGIPVIHIWYIVEEGARGLQLNAPLYRGIKDSGAVVRGSWGAAPAAGLEPQEGDFVVEKTRMNGFYGTRLDPILRALDTETLIITGAWTNMSIEHTARTGADKGYFMIVPEDGCSSMNADWHNASINFALQNVSTVTTCAAVLEALGAAAPA
jgi:gluconolactonase